MATAKEEINPYNLYRTQVKLAEGHKTFGRTAPRRDPKDDEGDSGTGSSEFKPPAHPLLADAVQFSGESPLENPVVTDNPDAQKEL